MNSYIIIFTLLIILVIGFLIRLIFLNKENVLPYHSRGALLTKSELNFYKQIKPILDQYGIYASFKPRLWDIIDVDKNTEKKFSWQNKISSKHVDFAIVDENAKILACLELDDPSHNRKDRMESDKLKNEALSSANVPLIRIKTNKTYNLVEFKNHIQNIF